MNEADVEARISDLEAHGDFRVLRRLRPIPVLHEAPAGCRRAVLVDVETTGLDPATDEIIEIAMVPFYYSVDDEVVGVGEAFSALRQPAGPIPPEMTKLTGIDDAMVAGRMIDPAEVSAFAGGNLMIAHNAGFDRLFLECFCPDSARSPWACSMSEVLWADEGFESAKLAFLALTSGFYYNRHRAVHDCHATVELLRRRLPRSGRTGLAVLLESARRRRVRCWAENSPFEAKDVLKCRGYRWNGDANGQPGSWWIDVGEAEIEGEIAWLRAEIYAREADLRTVRIDAFNRYSSRIVPGI